MRIFRTLFLVALVVGVAAACLRVVPREEWQRPADVIEALGLRGGERVADLGAGEGYFTFRLARAVGPAGVVYAVDVDGAALDALAERAQRESAPNVRARLVPADELVLPEAVDLIFTCNTYHHIDGQEAYFRRAAGLLRPGGRVVVVDMLPSQWLQRLTGHTSDPERVVEQMRAAGYALERRHDFLPEQSFLVFAPEGS